jgi:hypothetical protein
MDLNLKKMWPALAASLVAFTTVVNADYNSQQKSMTDQSGNQPKMQNNQTMVTNGKGPDMMITPNAYHTNTVFFSGEALFWWAREGGLEFGIKDPAYDSTYNVINEGQMLQPCPGWNAGFRIGLGYVFDRDGWDLDLWWTNYNNGQGDCDDDCSELCSTVSPIITMWSDLPPTTDDNIRAADYRTKWKVDLNIVDLELGRGFMTSKWLELRPFVGVRGSWIIDRYKINYSTLSGVETGAIPVPGSPTAVTEDEISMRNKWWGVGPRAGLNSRWGMGWGFSFYGNAALSLLYGKFKLSHSETLEGTTSTSTFEDVNELNYIDRWETGRAVADIVLGLEWVHDFKGNWGLGFNFGWEQHLFFSANQFWKIARTSSENIQVFSHERGDLSFQGFTLGGHIYF